MRILVTNDDGFFAEGIKALALALRQTGEVIVVAPSAQCSAVSHMINIYDSMRVKKIDYPCGIEAYSVSGSPADCCRLAVSTLLRDNPPDIVFSGINPGNNAGINALYSGTVAAAAEAVLRGIPAVAVSLDAVKKPDFSVAADFAVKFAQAVKDRPLKRGVLANINVPAVPAADIKGVRITEMSMYRYNEWYASHTDYHGRSHYWLEGEYRAVSDGRPESDMTAISEGYISITPLHFDLTCRPAISDFSGYRF